MMLTDQQRWRADIEVTCHTCQFVGRAELPRTKVQRLLSKHKGHDATFIFHSVHLSPRARVYA